MVICAGANVPLPKDFIVNRKQREAAKAQSDAQKQHRAAQQANANALAAQRETKIQAALSKRTDLIPSYWDAGQREVFVKAPKLLDNKEYRDAVNCLLKNPLLRPVHTWEPKGKGRDTLYRSLCEHCLAKYKVPPILWDAFFDELTPLVDMAVHVAAGGSLVEFVKDRFTVPLTRKMCHELLATPSDIKLMDAIRRVQVRAAGGDVRLYNALKGSRTAERPGTKEEEAFFATVIDWLSKVPMLEPGRVAPIVDYLMTKFMNDPKFSMKGRTGPAVMRDMEAWHGDLTKNKHIPLKIFTPSGFQPGKYNDYVRKDDHGNVVRETWEVRELLTARALHNEGRVMGHCVYSYAASVERGGTSIWTMEMSDGLGPTGTWGMLTIEVRNDLKRIVQARGRYNRTRTSKEQQVLTRWAGLNGLTINLGLY